MKKIISIIVLVALVSGATFFFINRKSSPEDQVVGTWYNGKNDQTIILNKDKSLEMTNKDEEKRTGTWKIAGDKIKLDLTSSADASGELPKGEIKSIYIEFDGLNKDNFYTFSGTFEKQ
ncbi:hypothetical protein ACVR0O_01420 [Streptococcus caviae]|uniref:hypothetical protein n=1 Tax=Streptococcus sp. 'caviae' TaxID=1915004 RepID=UPI00094BB5B3|nr:hypothetical protein [Streptococcus sp. 'caviae']OLN84602.1 hypothetical protein BMI76_00550 [Streptococcus sp. 'caviae']